MPHRSHAAYQLVLRGVVLTPAGEQPAAVLVSGGRIAALGEIDAVPAAERAITVEDGWIAPGFIDLQLNGGLGHDFVTTPEAVSEVARWLPRTGVTAFLPTLVTAPLEHLRRALAHLHAVLAEEPAGARPLGAHLEGPYLNPDFRGAHAIEWLRPLDLDELAMLCQAGPVRLVTLAPEQPAALAAVAWLRQRRIVVSAGHSGATYADACAAFAAGVTLGTHLFNAMAPFHHREPGLPGALLTATGVRASIIADGIHVHPAALSLAYRVRGPRGLALITDAMAALGKGDGRYQLAGRVVEVRDGMARLIDGTLAGSVVTMDAALRTMIQAAGCSVVDGVRMVSETPAAVLGLADRGRIVPGAAADLVVLDADLHVRLTVMGGHVVWERSTSGGDEGGVARAGA